MLAALVVLVGVFFVVIIILVVSTVEMFSPSAFHLHGFQKRFTKNSNLHQVIYQVLSRPFLVLAVGEMCTSQS